jgi:nucleoside-diphosphate kinase
MNDWTFVMLKPDALARDATSLVLAKLSASGYHATYRGEFWLRVPDVNDWYPEIADEPHYEELVRYLTSGPVAIVSLSGDNCFAAARAVKKSIREQWGSGELRNWIHCPDSPVDRDSEWELFEPRIREFALIPFSRTRTWRR